MQQQEVNWKKLDRKQRGKLLSERRKIVKTPKGWRVQSQSSKYTYEVRYTGDAPECTCPDCTIRKEKCKHIYAVEFFIKREIDAKGKLKQTKGVRITYGQKWAAYDKAQNNEKLFLMQLLHELCSAVEEPPYTFGRPKIAQADMVFCAVMKVYSTFSLRRCMSDIKIAHSYGFLDHVPSYASIGHYMQKEEVHDVLYDLIRISATPLAAVDVDFAADASGFSTCRFARYHDFKHKKDSKYRIWVKAHIMAGVKTNIITSAVITEGLAGDSPQLPRLVSETAQHFQLDEVACDKAYSSRDNLKLISEAGGKPFIPFKSNSTAKRGAMSVWGKMYHYFMFKHEEFLEHYHKRSNVETCFHMIKSKFKDNLRSKSKVAQVNELLLKILCHNLCVVIQEINELGLKGEFVVGQKSN